MRADVSVFGAKSDRSKKWWRQFLFGERTFLARNWTKYRFLGEKCHLL